MMALESCEEIAQIAGGFIAAAGMGPTAERVAALERLRELGLTHEHIAKIHYVAEEVLARRLAMAECELAEALGGLQ